jgi:hypothetical protein
MIACRDSVPEPNDTFNVVLTNPANDIIKTGTATVTNQNDL